MKMLSKEEDNLYSATGNVFLVLINTKLPSKMAAINMCKAKIVDKVLPETSDKVPPETMAGADGIVHLIDRNEKGQETTWNVKIINSDGSDGGFSGNGLRCAALCLFHKNSSRKTIKFSIKEQIVTATIDEENIVSLIFSNPWFKILKLTTLMKNSSFKKLLNVPALSLTCINVGNPHLIINTLKHKVYYTDEIKENLDKLRLNGNLTKEGLNVSIITKERDRWNIKTFERGVGETPGCGSAALAAFISLRCINITSSHHKNENDIALSFASKGGILKLFKKNNTIVLRGNVKKLFNDTSIMSHNVSRTHE